jgi:hypothetical protein
MDAQHLYKINEISKIFLRISFLIQVTRNKKVAFRNLGIILQKVEKQTRKIEQGLERDKELFCMENLYF